MKKTILVIVTVLMLFITTAFATDQPQTIVKEYEFITDNTNFDYDAPMEMTDNDIKYQRKDVQYEIIKETSQATIDIKVFEMELAEKGLEEKDDSLFEKVLQVDEDGFVGGLPLKEIVYTERKVTGRIASHTVEYNYNLQTEAPKPLSTLDVLYHDEKTNVDVLVTLDFVKLKETVKSHLENNIHVEQTYRSIYEDIYMLADGTRLSFFADKPQFEGIEEKILDQMRFDAKHYIITDSHWEGETLTKDGKTTRLAGYTVDRYVIGYSATYSGTFDIPNMLVYDATAVYEAELSKKVPNGTEYVVKATVTYEEMIAEQRNYVGAIAGAATGLIALCGLVIFLVKRKRKKIKAK